MQHAKHMPPVRAQDGKVNVELHLRLYPPESGGKFGFELSDDAEFWQRCISSEVAGSAVTYLAPTELLLHLIVHAVYDHQFTNGPLLISDLGQVLRKYSIDWPRFWDLANRGGHAKGAVLALRLVESYWGTLPVEWEHAGIGAEEIESDVLEASTQLILRDFEARRDVSLDHALSAQPTLMKKLGLVLGKLMPPKSRMASAYPVSEHSPWVYFWYPAHWWRLLGSRLPEYFAAKGQNHLQKEVVQLAVLNNWLR